MAYDPAEAIFYVDLAGVRWDTERHVRDNFVRIATLLRRWAGGAPQDFIIGYAGFQFDMVKLGTLYRELVVHAGEHYFKNLVRWGMDGDPLLRSTQRVFAIKTHRASHIYSTLAEAVDVMRGLRTGAIAIEE